MAVHRAPPSHIHKGVARVMTADSLAIISAHLMVADGHGPRTTPAATLSDDDEALW